MSVFLAKVRQLMDARVTFGIDAVLACGRKNAARIGLVTSSAAVTGRGEAVHVALSSAGFRVARLFSPEHGLAATAADGLAVSDSRDPATGLPVVSLYGSRLAPEGEQLSDLDEVWFDLPDIGTRFYTYLWTLYHTQQACAAAGKPMVLLDRPNPIGGDLALAEGPMLDTSTCGSFLGMAEMPIRHSLTIGELGTLWVREASLNLNLRVIPCGGWQRWMQWPDTGLRFHPTSPAIRSYESALLYPGLCLFEATNLSVGRGTTSPFQLIAAPWLRPELILPIMKGLVPEADFFPMECVPEWGLYAGRRCGVLKIVPVDPKRLRTVALGLRLLAAVINTHPEHFAWDNYETAANPSGARHFELLIGREGVRDWIASASRDQEDILNLTFVPDWAARTTEVLRY